MCVDDLKWAKLIYWFTLVWCQILVSSIIPSPYGLFWIPERLIYLLFLSNILTLLTLPVFIWVYVYIVYHIHHLSLAYFCLAINIESRLLNLSRLTYLLRSASRSLFLASHLWCLSEINSFQFTRIRFFIIVVTQTGLAKV